MDHVLECRPIPNSAKLYTVAEQYEQLFCAAHDN